MIFRTLLAAYTLAFALGQAFSEAEPAGGALAGERFRVFISTDIGGGDEDDDQSMVHYLMYSDLFDTEGLISSPPQQGRKKDLLEVIDAYEKDYPALRTHSAFYPAPDGLRAICKQGALEALPPPGHGEPTEGSKWLIECANRDDPRPLRVLVWGGISDVAQALHDDPGIKDKIRVHYIASWNRRNDEHSFQYIEENHPDLWIIQNETTFRGWYVGGDQSGDLGNRTYVEQAIAGKGALGTYFAPLKNGSIKMGDTPTVSWLLRGDPDDPESPGWGGRYQKRPGRPNWWVDLDDPALAEGDYLGAKTVNRWREDYLNDWRKRWRWVEEPRVFAERDGIIAGEAEHFSRQEKTGVRRWAVHTTAGAGDIQPDGDPNHAGTASGGAYIECLPDTRRSHGDKLTAGVNFANKPGEMAVLSYPIEIETPGRYHVWVSAYSTNTEDNGIHVGLDGEWPPSGARMQWCEGKNAWTWGSKQRTEANHCGEPYKIYLDIEEPGLHTLMFSMREDGFEFDRWLLTRGREYVPEP